MVSRRRKNKSSRRGQQPKRRMRMAASLDSAALKYARLLSDPCNADLCHPVYAGTEGGYLVRLKSFLTAGGSGSAVDSITCFNPFGRNDTGFQQWCATYASAGGGLGNVSEFGSMPWLSTGGVGYYRPVAGCLKVHYIGAELERKGLVSLIVGKQQCQYGDAYGSTTADALVPTSAKTVRLGSEPHELRWAPMTPDDTEYSTQYQPGGSYTPVGVVKGTVLTVIVQGAPAGSVRLEVDFVYEWLPEYSSGLVNSITTPPSRNTLNDVLRAIGNAAGGIQEWAVSSQGKRVLGAIGRGVYSMVNNGGLLALTG